jgi:hypothetical protein
VILIGFALDQKPEAEKRMDPQLIESGHQDRFTETGVSAESKI